MLFSPQILVRNQPQPIVAAGGPFTFVASVSAQPFASGGGTTTGINTTGAGLLICVTSYFSGATGVTMADSKSNTWTPLTAATSANTKCNVYYSVPTSVGASHTASFTGSSLFPTFYFAAFAFGAASPADQQSTNNGSSTSATSTSITPSVDNELVIAGVGTNANGAAITAPGGSFTTINSTLAASSGNAIGGGAAYWIQTTASAASPTWTVASSSDWTTKMASFKVV